MNKLTSAIVEKKLKHNLPYKYIPIRVKAVESMRFPVLVRCFHDLVDSGYFPSQGEYTAKYLGDNIDAIDKKLKDGDMASGLMGRLTRVYPSLVRELHLSLMLMENEDLKNAEAHIERSTDLDLRGIDLQVTIGDKIFAVKIFQGTNNSMAWRRLKDTHRDNPENMKNKIPIEAIFKKGRDQTINGFWLFTREYADELAKELINHGKYAEKGS